MESALPGFAIEIEARIADHDPTDEGDERGHRGADRVEPEADEAAQGGDGRRTGHNLLQEARKGQGKRGNGRHLGDPRQPAWAPARCADGKERGGQHGQRRKQCQDRQGHGCALVCGAAREIRLA